jgi:NhaA family Na+:H+ antiporter
VNDARGPILLLGASVAALALANSPLAGAYEHALHWSLLPGMTLHDFVNDALMAVFFFAIGLEIKRELAIGELSSVSRAALPAFGALGGMVVPAGVYAALQAGGPGLHGWGIPMATDIAFAIAALGIFGARASPGLKVFLLALAIVDDIGSVLVIAIFYSSHLAVAWLGAALAGLALCVALGRSGVRSYSVYVVVGAAVWYAMFRSGVHATIAGVALGLLTPARPLAGRTQSPIDELEHRLHGWVALAILPLFALCNAGVALDASSLGDPLAQRVALGVAAGLLAGKPIGIALVAWVAVRLGLAELPRGTSWGQIAAVGVLAGIGFTVALFIAALAFAEETLVAGAKIGVLAASVLATGLGVGLLQIILPHRSEIEG